MEEIKSSNSSNNKQRRQKIVVGGVGGIAGVLILAGAFAAASFIKNKGSNKKPDTINLEGPSSPTQKTNISNKEEGSEGLRSILQTLSPSAESHNCSTSSSIEHDPSKGSSTDIGCHLETKHVETTNMEEISTIEVNVEEQIFACEGKMIESGNSNSNHSCNNSSSEEVESKLPSSALQILSPSVESHQSSIEHEASKAISTQVDDHSETGTAGIMIMEEISTIEVNVEEQIFTCEGKMTESGNSNNSSSEEVESKLLSSALQILSPLVESHQSSIEHEASKVISTLVDDHSDNQAAGIMIMEETSVTTDYVEENVSIREDHKNESGNSKDENLCTDDIDMMIKAEIFSESSEESPSIHNIEEEDQSDSRVTVSIIKESDLPEITHVSEENLLTPLKEEEEEYDPEEDKTERETKSSEDSFIGSNSEEVLPLKVTPIQIDNHSETETTEAPIKHETSTMENYVNKETSIWEDQRLESGNLKAESLWTLNIDDNTKDGRFLTSCGGTSSLDIDEAILGADSIKKNHSDLASTIAEDDQPEATHVNDAFMEEISSVPLEEVEYTGEGDEMEREIEDSEGTPDSSIESNSEAVWPTELIEEELPLLKDNKHTQILRHKNDKETSKEAQFEGAFNNLSSLSMDKEIKLLCPPFLIKSRPEFWLWSLLAVALVCLFFGNHLPIIYHHSDTQL